MAGPTDDRRRAFVHDKAAELAEYMRTQGWDYGKTGASLLGLAAGWIAQHHGNKVAFEALDMARASIEHHTGTKKTN